MNVDLYYNNEINYIVKQIKAIFNLDAVSVELSLKNLCYKLTFIGHPLFTFRVKIILYEELRTKSYLSIIKEISNYLINEMEL